MNVMQKSARNSCKTEPKKTSLVKTGTSHFEGVADTRKCKFRGLKITQLPVSALTKTSQHSCQIYFPALSFKCISSTVPRVTAVITQRNMDQRNHKGFRREIVGKAGKEHILWAQEKRERIVLRNPLCTPTILVPAALALCCAQSVSFEPSFCHLPRERKNRDRRLWDRPKPPAESLFMMMYVMTEMQWDRGLDKHSSDWLRSHALCSTDHTVREALGLLSSSKHHLTLTWRDLTAQRK